MFPIKLPFNKKFYLGFLFKLWVASEYRYSLCQVKGQVNEFMIEMKAVSYIS